MTITDQVKGETLRAQLFIATHNMGDIVEMVVKAHAQVVEGAITYVEFLRWTTALNTSLMECMTLAEELDAHNRYVRDEAARLKEMKK